MVNDDVDPFPGEIVDNRQCPDPATIGERITDKIHRPYLVRAGRQHQLLALDSDTVTLAPSLNGQAGFLIKPKNALVVRFYAFTMQQCVDAPVTKSMTCNWKRIGVHSEAHPESMSLGNKAAPRSGMALTNCPTWKI